MGLFSTIGSALMPGIGTAIGGYLDYKSSKDAADDSYAATTAAQDQAYQRSLPWDVSGMFGTADFDPTTRQLTLGLDEDWQSEYETALAGAAKQREYISGIEADPWTAGQKFYEQQKALYAPEQEQQRLDLEKRLLGQGLMGATGGALQMGSLLEAQAQQDREAQYAGLDKAQQMIDLYRARSTGDLAQAQTIGQLPQTYAETGQGLGGDLSSLTELAQGQSAAAAAQAQAEATRQQKLGTMFTSLFN